MHVLKEGTSKQAWLATVQHCPSCGGQRPKLGFKRVRDQDICADCQTEDELTYSEQIHELAKWALSMNDVAMLRAALQRILLLSRTS